MAVGDRRHGHGGFAGGLKRDLAAVRAALSLPWSTGPVEGQISRLKTIKRTMDGRGGFDLLPIVSSKLLGQSVQACPLHRECGWTGIQPAPTAKAVHLDHYSRFG